MCLKYLQPSRWLDSNLVARKQCSRNSGLLSISGAKIAACRLNRLKASVKMVPVSLKISLALFWPLSVATYRRRSDAVSIPVDSKRIITGHLHDASRTQWSRESSLAAT